MITTRNESGTFTAFQRVEGSSKVGVICEADTLAGAMGGAFEQLVKLKGAAGIPDQDNPFKKEAGA